MTWLKDSFKVSGREFDKVVSPRETLAWVHGRLRDSGIRLLHGTERIDKGRLGIPVFVSRYCAAASRLTGTAKQMGKGATPAQAEASAVMELVERFSLFVFVKERPHRASRLQSSNEADFPLDHMFRGIHVPPPTGGDLDRTVRLVKMLPLKWARAYRLWDGHEAWLPWSWFWPVNEYNGSAAGNSLEEAGVQAMCEVVERHVCSLVSYEHLTAPSISPDSLNDPVAKDLLSRFRRLGIEVVLKDFSCCMDIPTVGAIAWDPSTFPERSEIVYTAGTAPDPERAVVRALTEVAQLAGDFDTEGRYVESGLPKFASLEEASGVLASPSTVSIRDLPRHGSENFRAELESLALALAGRGLDAYLLDITHPELGIPAVYVVIPGNHFRERTRGLDAVFHCSRLAAALDSPGEALSVLRAAENTFPGRYDVAFYTGHALEKAGRHAEALEWYGRALERGPDPGEVASIYCHRGLCYKELGDFPEAIGQLERSLTLNAGLKETHNLLGYCLYRTGEHARAIEAFEHAIAIDPGSAVDYANIASNLRCLGMTHEASRWYEMAMELDPELEWARRQMQELALGCVTE